MGGNATDNIIVVKRKKLQYTDDDLKRALEAIEKGMTVFSSSKKYGVPYQTLRDKVNGKSVKSRRHSGLASILTVDIENKLVSWVQTCARQGFAIDKTILLDNVQKIVLANNLKTPFKDGRPSKKWFYSFMGRHKVLSQKKAEYINGARGSVTEQAIRRWFSNVIETLGDHGDVLNDPSRVFNMDETAFQLSPKTNLVIGERGRTLYNESSRSNKESITTLFSVNAIGTFAPPLTLYKYARLPKHIVDSAPPYWSIGKTDSGWMTAESFYEYISNVFLPFVKAENIELPVIVFLDGHSSHMSLELSEFCSDNQIILIALFPNATHILQPLDVAVYGPMKAKWKSMCRQWRIDHEGREIGKEDIPFALSRFIGGDTSMQGNVIAGFRATGIFPFDPNNVDYTKIIDRSVQTVESVPGK